MIDYIIKYFSNSTNGYLFSLLLVVILFFIVLLKIIDYFKNNIFNLLDVRIKIIEDVILKISSSMDIFLKYKEKVDYIYNNFNKIDILVNMIDSKGYKQIISFLYNFIGDVFMMYINEEKKQLKIDIGNIEDNLNKICFYYKDRFDKMDCNIDNYFIVLVSYFLEMFYNKCKYLNYLLNDISNKDIDKIMIVLFFNTFSVIVDYVYYIIYLYENNEKIDIEVIKDEFEKIFNFNFKKNLININCNFFV